MPGNAVGCRRPEGRVDCGSECLDFLEDLRLQEMRWETLGWGEKALHPLGWVQEGEAMDGPGKAGGKPRKEKAPLLLAQVLTMSHWPASNWSAPWEFVILGFSGWPPGSGRCSLPSSCRSIWPR